MIRLNFPRSTDIAQKETVYSTTLEIIVQGLYFIQKGQKKITFSYKGEKKKKEKERECLVAELPKGRQSWGS